VNIPATSEQLWDAIYRIGSEDGTADKIQPAVIAKLIELKMAKRALPACRNSRPTAKSVL
jgi:hypothetical protein